MPGFNLPARLNQLLVGLVRSFGLSSKSMLCGKVIQTSVCIPLSSPEKFLGATPTTEKLRPLRVIVLFSTDGSRLRSLVQRASLITAARGAPGASSEEANADPMVGWAPSTEK